MILTPLPDDTIVQSKNQMTTPWFSWFNRLFFLAQALGDSGVTALRPTKSLYVGRNYFDTTLGKPIWIQSLNPTVWVDATGAAV